MWERIADGSRHMGHKMTSNSAVAVVVAAVLGVLMVLMALQTWEIFNFIPSINLIFKNKRCGLFGAFLAGILGGIFFLCALRRF